MMNDRGILGPGIMITPVVMPLHQLPFQPKDLILHAFRGSNICTCYLAKNTQHCLLGDWEQPMTTVTPWPVARHRSDKTTLSS